ncbi:MAG TPA: HAMP domain-containing sensor histidine kinase [Terriglobia bacterium]|nr:HAMP domain-containing sensor histidine kinase [Terriglobia bacterium]
MRRLSCSPDGPLTRSPAHPLSRSPDSNDCRDCLAAMAHRLAQPMTALRGGIELGLMGKRSPADYRALLEQSLELADNMAQLIVSLRDLGESGAPGGPSQCVLLEAAVAEVLAEMEGLSESRELRVQLKAEGAIKVCASPQRLREALQSLLAWVIQNSAGGGVIAMELSASEGEAQLFLSPPRLDLQYLQVKVLEDITNPGLLFSHAAKNGALGWAINQRLLDGLGGKLEILTDGPAAGCIRVCFPLALSS